MTTDRTEAFEVLLAEAEAAHGLYETTVLGGVYDQEWPRWYAQYAVDHDVSALVGRVVSTDELADLLEHSWNAFQQADPKPTDPWARSTARLMATDLQARD